MSAWGLPVAADGVAKFRDICVEAFAGFRRVRIPRVHGVQRLSLSNARFKHMRDAAAQKDAIATGTGSVESIHSAHLKNKDKSGKAVGITMIKPGTGAIVAMAQNRSWGRGGIGKTAVNYNAPLDHNGTVGFQAGSTFKQGSWNLGNKWKWMAPLAILICGDLSKEQNRGYWVQDCASESEARALLEWMERKT